MKKHITTLLTLAATFSTGLIPVEAAEEYIAGPYSSFRMRLGEFLDDLDVVRWRDTVIIGYAGTGYPLRGAIRMGVDQAYGEGNDVFIPLEKLEQATKITWTTGIVWKQTTNGDPSLDGGVDLAVYFVPDLVVPEGSSPDFSHYEFDKYPGAVKVADIPRNEPFTNPEENWGIELMDREHLTIEIDITDAVKAALDQGLIVSGNSIAMGMLQTEYNEFDPAQIPVGFQDIQRMNIMAAEQSFFTLSFDDVGPDMGPGVFSDYELVDGYVNTGDWMGWVYVEDYPWALVVNLNKYVYSGGNGWFFIRK